MHRTEPYSSAPPRESVVHDLYCPFPSLLNPHLERAQAHTMAWAREQELLEGEALRRAGSARIAWMIAGFYPWAEPDRLFVASDYLAWAYALDDVGDESATGHRAATLGDRFEAFERVFAGHPADDGEGPLTRGLRDIVRRLRPLCTSEQLAAFHRGNQAYWGAMLWEARNREAGVVPSETVFLAMRPAAGAVPPFFALIEPIEQLLLSPEVRRHALFVEIVRIVGRVMCVINDVLSHRKERSHQDVHNLVMVLETHRGLNPSASIDEVIRFTNREVRQFQELAAALVHQFPSEEETVKRQLEVFRAMMRVTLDWTYGSSRYGLDAG